MDDRSRKAGKITQVVKSERRWIKEGKRKGCSAVRVILIPMVRLQAINGNRGPRMRALGTGGANCMHIGSTLPKLISRDGCCMLSTVISCRYAMIGE